MTKACWAMSNPHHRPLSREERGDQASSFTIEANILIVQGQSLHFGEDNWRYEHVLTMARPPARYAALPADRRTDTRIDPQRRAAGGMSPAHGAPACRGSWPYTPDRAIRLYRTPNAGVDRVVRRARHLRR